MNVLVNLNDIFDLTTPTVLQKRIDLAFENGVKGFWGNFFHCDNFHKDAKIVYLFTEYQLKILSNWLKDKLNNTKDKDEKKFLTSSI